MEKILITGGNGNLGKEIIKAGVDKYKFINPRQYEMDICDIGIIEDFILKYNPKYLIHSAALTKPMEIHEEDITKSIDINIIGTANIVKICKKYNIKLIYVSTDYVYPTGSKNIKEFDCLQPINNYGWSKLGGECSVKMYKNSLILRLSFINKPFPFEFGVSNIIRNVLYVDEVSKIILSVLNEIGILNIGGDKIKSMYEVGLETNPKLTPILIDDKIANEKSIILNIDRLKKIQNKNENN